MGLFGRTRAELRNRIGELWMELHFTRQTLRTLWNPKVEIGGIVFYPVPRVIVTDKPLTVEAYERVLGAFSDSEMPYSLPLDRDGYGDVITVAEGWKLFTEEVIV